MISLAANRLFNQLSPVELQALEKVAREQTYSARQDIFKEGDPGDGVYLVHQGQVEITAAVSSGERLVISQALPGDYFGEMAVLDNQPRSASATASTGTRLYFIPREQMVDALKRSPTVALTLLQEFSGRTREFNRQYTRTVLQAERMAVVGRFASAIVHDLKNPLAIISFAAELTGQPNVTPEMLQTAQQRIIKQVGRINSMVSDLLEFTRDAPTGMALVTRDYAGFVRDLVAELQPELTQRNVTLQLDNAPPGVNVPMHPQRLARVFHNLIFNAVDALPNGGNIRMSVETTGHEVRTAIADTGPGVAPEIIGQLFEAFATFGKPRGTGLGLHICRRIISEHGGQIAARNQDGGGAVFTFTLARSA